MTASTHYMMQIHMPRGDRPWTCRVCGCSRDEHCVTEVGQDRAGRPPLDMQTHAERAVDRGHCHPIGDVCSRCHSDRHPTIRQLHELHRIQARCGPVSILYVNRRAELEIIIADRPRIIALRP